MGDRRILITGSAGMLGKDIVSYLDKIAESGVVELDHRFDICKPNDINRQIDLWNPTIIIHCAALTDVERCEREPNTAFLVNSYGSAVVAQAAESVGATMVYISTDFVFDGTKETPYHEYDVVNPINHYGASKLAGEQEALRLCSKTYVVRTSWLYGVNGNNFPFKIISKAKTGEDIQVPNQVGTPTYSKDLVEAILNHVIHLPVYGVYHVANSEPVTRAMFSRVILDKAGLQLRRVVTVKDLGKTKRPVYSALTNLTGQVRLRPWEEALTAFMDEAKGLGQI